MENDSGAEIVVNLLQPVKRLLDFMRSPGPVDLSSIFSSDPVTIVDSFMPHVFTGADAASEWAAAFRASMQSRAVRDLGYDIGEPQLLASKGDRAYCSVPVTWTGSSKGRSFHELGALAVVYVRSQGGWRIQFLSWASVSYACDEKAGST